jgi:crotonobetainyl-CoA:carnitine CoA-transferase CaiB-like acyl-CoA transferase
VTKIEPPAGDPLALACPEWYARLHAGVEVLPCDLKAAEGQAALDRLLGGSDLLLTAGRPASLARLGLAWPELAGRYPRLCQVAIVGYRPPAGERPGHDLTYQAELSLVEPPRLPLTVLTDLAGAERAAAAALALLLGRERAVAAGRMPPPEERFALVPLAEAAADMAEPLRLGLTAPGGPLGGGLPGYALYRAAEGWVAVAALEGHFQARLAAGLGLPELTHKALAAAFAARPAAEWQTWAAGLDLPLVAVKLQEGFHQKRSGD